MLRPFEEGPRERWQAEMEKLDREALLVLTRSLLSTLRYLGLGSHIGLDDIRAAKKQGRFVALSKRSDRFLADPQKFVAESVRRSKAAKRAARRRKRNAR